MLTSAVTHLTIAVRLTQADIDFAFDPAMGYEVSNLIWLSPKGMDEIGSQSWRMDSW